MPQKVTPVSDAIPTSQLQNILATGRLEAQETGDGSGNARSPSYSDSPVFGRSIYASGMMLPDYAEHYSTLRSGAKATWMERFTMRFPDPHHEREYERWLYHKNRGRWIALWAALCFWGLLVYAAYAVLGFVSESHGCNIYSHGNCPGQAYDGPQKYYWQAELSFWVASSPFPSLVLVVCYKWLSFEHKARFGGPIFTAVFSIAVILSTAVRPYVIDNHGDPWLYCLINVMCVVLIPMLGALASYLTTIYAFLDLIAMLLAFSPRIGDGDLATPLSLAMIAGSAVVVIGLTRYVETIERRQFAITFGMDRANRGLRDRLHGLQREYSVQAADLETPMEKAIATIKSVMADPSLSRDAFDHLAKVQVWLSNSDKLFTPDLEAQLTAGVTGVDEEQELWLLHLLAGNRGIRRTLLEKIRSHRSQSSSGHGSAFGKVSQVRESLQRLDRAVANELTGIYASLLANAPPPSSPMVPQPDGVKDAEHSSDELSDLPGNPQQVPDEFGSARRKSVLDDVVLISQDSSVVEPSVRISHSYQLRSQPPPSPARYNAGAASSPVPVPRKKEKVRLSPLVVDNIPKLEDAGRIRVLLEGINVWTWSIFELEAVTGLRTLSVIATHLIHSSGLPDRLGISTIKLNKFLRRVESLYHADVPYHNASHAADVLQAIQCFIGTSDLELSDVELFAAYIAATVHDLDHPGLNNKFLIESRDPKAILYNDRSVLENHHLATAFSVMMREETNILESMSRDQAHKFRDTVIGMVLATDISEHFTTLAQFKNKVSGTGNFDPKTNAGDRFSVLQMLIKCADVSNLSRDWATYTVWLERLMREFVSQGDQEKLMNLPVSPFMDRENINIPQSQLGFIDYICQPMVEIMIKVLPLPPMLDFLLANKEKLQRIRDKESRYRSRAPGSLTGMFSRWSSTSATASSPVVVDE
ncbi:cAMP-specific 3',5'-cyclic phosphodiesterase 4D [Geranomyces variabilis]|uniref:Phosphodiesterase n=1 Tax=Geranomyces variabilis TaxID=109894 RepID=A0AAD5TN73_9FUNG|nr:cAMP-specific 3',5'-cyclic phosphodiesterase 4D [Geranomyces variabilis]